MQLNKTEQFILHVALHNNSIVSIRTGKQSTRLPKTFGNRRSKAGIHLRDLKLLKFVELKQTHIDNIDYNVTVYRLTERGFQEALKLSNFGSNS